MMTNFSNVDYIDDTSIDPELMCNICFEHFQDPYCTPCDHTFCRQCIIERIDSGSAICPRCANPLSILHIQQASRTIRDMLTRARVVCRYCGQTGLQKENFNEHLNRGCPKTQVTCPAEDVKCSWTGERDQLDHHLKTCAYYSLHAILSKLMTDNRQLKEQMKQMDQHCQEKHLQHTNDIDATTNHIHTSIKQMNDQLDVDESRIEKHDFEIEYLKNQITQLESQIKKLQEENQLKKNDTLRLSQQCSQHEIQIKQLTKKLNLIVGE
jgi:DNA repair exonuclease SbcCD ATPase subunit